VLSVVTGTTPGVAGFALQDSPSNEAHENDSPSGSGASLGVYVGQVVKLFNEAFNNDELPAARVSEADLPALRALVYGLPDAGGRTELLRYVGRGLGRAIADVAAHEIGHSLGLLHTNPSTPGSIMNAGPSVSPYAEDSFLPSDLAALARALPGPGRRGESPAKPHDRVAPSGGVCECHFRE
jgi:hypothetical protein